MIVQSMPAEAWYNDEVTLLPTEILHDDWVLYHGTSNLIEKDIETNGFHADRASLITKEVIQKIVDCFNRLNWYGDDGGGYCVLKPFTLQHDHSYYESKPIFLGESCRRSLLYATKDFAGGEGARSVRKSIRDLRSFLENEEVRLNALMKPIKETLNEFGDVLYADTPLCETELGWLYEALRKLESVEHYVNNCSENHEYGIVYAIRFNEDDIVHMGSNSSMGLTYSGPLNSDKIIAKLLVSQDANDCGFPYDKQRSTNHMIWKERIPAVIKAGSSV